MKDKLNYNVADLMLDTKTGKFYIKWRNKKEPEREEIRIKIKRSAEK